MLDINQHINIRNDENRISEIFHPVYPKSNQNNDLILTMKEIFFQNEDLTNNNDITDKWCLITAKKKFNLGRIVSKSENSFGIMYYTQNYNWEDNNWRAIPLKRILIVTDLIFREKINSWGRFKINHFIIQQMKKRDNNYDFNFNPKGNGLFITSEIRTDELNKMKIFIFNFKNKLLEKVEFGTPFAEAFSYKFNRQIDPICKNEKFRFLRNNLFRKYQGNKDKTIENFDMNKNANINMSGREYLEYGKYLKNSLWIYDNLKEQSAMNSERLDEIVEIIENGNLNDELEEELEDEKKELTTWLHTAAAAQSRNNNDMFEKNMIFNCLPELKIYTKDRPNINDHLKSEFDKIIDLKCHIYHENMHFDELEDTWKEDFENHLNCIYFGKTGGHVHGEWLNYDSRDCVIIKDKYNQKFNYYTRDLSYYTKYALWGTFSEPECLAMESFFQLKYDRIPRPHKMWVGTDVGTYGNKDKIGFFIVYMVCIPFSHFQNIEATYWDDGQNQQHRIDI